MTFVCKTVNIIFIEYLGSTGLSQMSENKGAKNVKFRYRVAASGADALKKLISATRSWVRST